MHISKGHSHETLILTLIKTISAYRDIVLMKQPVRHKILTTLIEQSLIANMFQAFSVSYQSTFALGVAS